MGDPKIAECFSGLETQVQDLTAAIMGPEGGEGTLEDKITLVLVKKGVISCENETQCDDVKIHVRDQKLSIVMFLSLSVFLRIKLLHADAKKTSMVMEQRSVFPW